MAINTFSWLLQDDPGRCPPQRLQREAVKRRTPLQMRAHSAIPGHEVIEGHVWDELGSTGRARPP